MASYNSNNDNLSNLAGFNLEVELSTISKQTTCTYLPTINLTS